MVPIIGALVLLSLMGAILGVAYARQRAAKTVLRDSE